MSNPGPSAKAAANRKLGLDKPCSMCGSPIYYNYRGPIDHICGKCTDQLRRRLQPRSANPAGGVVRTRVQSGFGWGSLLLAALSGAAIAIIVLHSGLVPL